MPCPPPPLPPLPLTSMTLEAVVDFSPLSDEADEIVFALAAEHIMSDINAAAAIDLIIGGPSFIIQPADAILHGKGFAKVV